VLTISSDPAAFGRLCVETVSQVNNITVNGAQPPSGGCVLKQRRRSDDSLRRNPAAFGRLCVET